jgi:hypothetical protein
MTNNPQSYQACIDACLQCAFICNHCASSCTQEKNIEMLAKCIQLDMECSAICYAAAQLMSLNSSHAKALCRLCAEICEECGRECSKHDHEHCRVCADMCKKCAAACREMAGMTA